MPSSPAAPSSRPRLPNSSIPASSPAFATPAFSLRPIPVIPPSIPTRESTKAAASTNTNALRPTILPIKLPAGTLRSIAFRTFTKKHSLTLTPAVLALLATFIGKHCGAGWRDEGLAEGVLDEVARGWKKCGGGVIVEADERMGRILKNVEGMMVGGRVEKAGGAAGVGPTSGGKEENGIIEDDKLVKDVRKWVTVVNAFEMPRLVFNPAKKLFDRDLTAPSIFPSPKHRTAAFRNRYSLTQHRISRNPSFLQSTGVVGGMAKTTNTITQVSNLLGRHNSNHLLFGLLSHTATGLLALSDPSGTVVLDMRNATSLPSPGAAWFTPGMMVLTEGVYREDGTAGATEQTVGASGGIGGTINGVFVASVLGHPPGERRTMSLGLVGGDGAFGWTDFLGLGSERGTGERMRMVMDRVMEVNEAGNRSSSSNTQRSGPSQLPVIAIASCLDLSSPATMPSLRTLLKAYSDPSISSPPIAIVLMGPFITTTASFPSQPRAAAAFSASGLPGSGMSAYKEGFDSLAAVLAEFPTVISKTTVIFVPADADAWPSAVGNGAAVPIPQKGVPDLFTRSIRRVGLDANSGAVSSNSGTTPPSPFEPNTKAGEIVWTTNPSRISWFGCLGELVLFRDDLLGRMQRQAITFPAEVAAAAAAAEEAALNLEDDEPIPDSAMNLTTARRLTKTIVDQGYLSPFPINSRPVHVDYSNTLNVYPLPSAIVVADSDAPAWAIQYLGCWVMNPGSIVYVDGEEDGTAAANVTFVVNPDDTTGVSGAKAKGREKTGKDGLFAGLSDRAAKPVGSARWIEYDIQLGKGRVRVEKA